MLHEGRRRPVMGAILTVVVGAVHVEVVIAAAFGDLSVNEL